MSHRMGSKPKAQMNGEIVIKSADKGGGVVVMNTEDYITEMNTQLNAQCNSESGKVPFYVSATQHELKNQVKDIIDLIEAGHKNGFISDNDKAAMKPENKPGRLYGQPKVHKGLKEGAKFHHVAPLSAIVVPTLRKFLHM